MKRCAKMVMLFLLLGAIINVAVAWGCLLYCYRNYLNEGSAAWTAAGPGWHEQFVYYREGDTGTGQLRAGFAAFSMTRATSSPGVTYHQQVPPNLIPAQPIWPGFAINTIFYAAVLWLPFAELGTFRRRRRMKRGLCVRCGYSLRGNSGGCTCPECGAAIAMPDSRKPTAESPQ
jgi:hypothetical protein